MVDRHDPMSRTGEDPARHYEIDRWVDFARGLADERESSAMRNHLELGCSECGPFADFFTELSGVCRSMASCAVPDTVLHQAYRIFPVRVPSRPKRVFRIPVELVFDSFLAPAPAGLRATWQVGWQGLYRAGDCSLDLRIEPELRSARAAVIGQISNHTLPEQRMSDVPVCLKSGRLVVAETRSNQFGEFQMEYEQQGRLHLCVYLDAGSKCIQVQLKRFAADRPAGTERLKLDPPAGRKRPRTDQD
jgi:hypothetical protein